jgi:hypothetical protein
MKLAFGVPWTSPFLYTSAVDAFMNLARPQRARNDQGHREPLETRFFRGPGWCPARRHIALCEQALAWGADLICIMGADQVHPEDTLVRLVERWDQGYQIVAALVPARGYIGWQPMEPFQRMAWRIKPAAIASADAVLRGEAQNATELIDPAAGPIQRIHFIGSGVLMFHRDHLLALKQPWFVEQINPDTYERLASMDTTFVWRLQTEAGATVWVDTTIPVKHLHTFAVDDTFPARFPDWKVEGQGAPDVCMYQQFRKEA